MSEEVKEEVQKITDELITIQQHIEALPDGNRWGPLIDAMRDIAKTTDRLKRCLSVQMAEE